MLVTFKTEAYAHIMMFGKDALFMIKAMGHSGTVPGAILAEDVPAALACLKSVLEAERVKNNEQEEGDDEDTPSVNMLKRGLPLMELLTAAANDKCNVMWE